MSFVLVSPSTVISWNERSTARRSTPRSACGSTGASVATTASIVAMSGWIMPEPFAVPPTVATKGGAPPGPAGSATRTAAVLVQVSVVRMARAKSSPDPGARRRAASAIPA